MVSYGPHVYGDRLQNEYITYAILKAKIDISAYRVWIGKLQFQLDLSIPDSSAYSETVAEPEVIIYKVIIAAACGFGKSYLLLSTNTSA